MQNNLLAIDEIIARARKSGTFLGHGDPKVHLAYLTKIRLLPQTLRRKIGTKIVGCYPEQILTTLKKIEELKSSGLSYSQIRYQLQGSAPVLPGFLPVYPLTHDRYSSLAFLLIGLILGFLVATNYSGGNIKMAQATALPENTNTTLVKVESGQTSSPEPIYLIAIPEQNLYKLGETNINLLKQ